MKVLLDTHVFLWWNIDDPRLSKKARAVISNPGNTLILSVASAWEIAIKVQAGKLRLPSDPATYVQDRAARNHMEILPIQLKHAVELHSLPLNHRDPFDRILIVQSLIEGLPIMTADEHFRSYTVDIVW